MGIVRSTGIRSASRFLIAFSRFFITGYIALFLGAKTLGLFGLYRTVVLFASVLADFGLQQAIVKRISEDTEADRYFSAFLMLTCVLTVGVVLVCFRIRPVITSYIGRDILGWLLLGLVGQIGIGVTNSTLVGENKIERLSIVEFVQRLSTTGVQFALIVGFSLGIQGLILGEILGFVCGTFLGVRWFSVRPRIPKYRHFVGLFRFARYSWITPISQRIRSKMDVFVLGLFLPTSTIGVYELVWMASSFYSYIPQSLQIALFPEISGRHADGEEFDSLVKKSFSFIPLFILPGIVGAMVIGKPLLGIFGQEFQTGYTALVLLILARLAMAYYDILTSYHSGIDRPDRVAWSTGILIVINIVGNMVMIPRVGITGAAITTVLSFTLATGFLVGAQPSIFRGIRPRPITTGVASSLVMGIATFSAHYYFKPLIARSTLVVGCILLGVVIYGSAIWWTTPHLRELLRRQVDS